jgi:hypothetical protein
MDKSLPTQAGQLSDSCFGNRADLRLTVSGSTHTNTTTPRLNLRKGMLPLKGAHARLLLCSEIVPSDPTILVRRTASAYFIGRIIRGLDIGRDQAR